MDTEEIKDDQTRSPSVEAQDFPKAISSSRGFLKEPYAEKIHIFPQSLRVHAVNSLTELYYGDDDITDYIKYSLHGKNTSYFKDSKYLLTAHQEDQFVCPILDTKDNTSYFVAVCPAINTTGSSYEKRLKTGGSTASTNLEYFFDKNTRPKDIDEEIFENLLQFKPTPGACHYVELLQKIEAIRESTPNLSLIDHILSSEGEDIEKLQAKFQQTFDTIQKGKIDVFDELMPPLLKLQNSYAKILFPYNKTQLHWLTGELLIQKKGEEYTIKAYAHDPYGGGKMSEANFTKLEAVVRKRIKDYHLAVQTLSCQNLESPFGTRQNPEDVISCGVIAAEDLINLITGPLDNFCYPIGADQLRYLHIETVRSIDPEAAFIKRNEMYIREHDTQLITVDDFSIQEHGGKRDSQYVSRAYYPQGKSSTRSSKRRVSGQNLGYSSPQQNEEITQQEIATEVNKINASYKGATDKQNRTEYLKAIEDASEQIFKLLDKIS